MHKIKWEIQQSEFLPCYCTCFLNGVLLDQIGKLTGFYTAKEYPEKLRRIKFYDEETDNHLTFLSNNFDLKAEEIAQLYKYRWKVELFTNQNYQDVKELYDKQLKISWI